jgi:FKBP-type peptidyl-prolyl cis-trans isomerase 2
LLTLGWKFIARLSRISRSVTCFLTLAVVKVGLKFADIDNNHPMAGKTLTVDADIIELPV